MHRIFLQATVLLLFLNETAISVLEMVTTQIQLVAVVPGSIASMNLRRPNLPQTDPGSAAAVLPEIADYRISSAKTQIIAGYCSHATLGAVNLFIIWRYYLLTKRWWLS